MSCFKVVCFAFAAVAAAQECQNCESDELELLQAKADKAEENFAENSLETDKKFTDYDVEKFPDLSKILGDGGAIASGIGQVTSRMGETLTTLDTKMEKEELMFNQTIRQFNMAANATASVTRNATKFKALIGSTVARYVPFYKSAMEQVTTAIKTTKAVAALIGQEELNEKLEKLSSTAMEKLGALADTSEALATKVATTGTEKYNDISGDVKEKLKSLASTAGSFRQSFSSNLDSVMDTLEAPLQLAVGDKAKQDIMEIKLQAATMLSDLEKFAVIVKDGLTTAADGVDIQKMTGGKKGFFDKIFGGLFR
eukprot:Skav203986  [mRNA]  locus=scaffold3369:114900:115835:- [translate_table: standard]